MKTKNEYLSLFSIGFILFLSLNLLLSKTLSFNTSTKLIFIISIIIWVLVYLLTIFLKKIRFMILVLLATYPLITIGLIPKYVYMYSLYLIPNKYNFIIKYINYDKFNEFLNWIFSYMFSSQMTTIPDRFDVYMLILVYPLIAIVLSLTLVKSKRIIYFMLPILYFFFEWLRYEDKAFSYFNLYILGLIPLIYNYYYKKKIITVKEKGFRHKKFVYSDIVIYGAILGVIFIVISNVITFILPLELIDSKLSILTSNNQFRSTYGSGEGGKYTFLGKTGTLGGPIKIDDTILMYVDTSKRVYLRGSIKDVYTGHSWESTNNSYYGAYNNQIKTDDLNIDKSKTTVTIYPTNILTRTIFTPYRPYNIDIKGKNVNYNNDFEVYYENKLFNTKVKSYTVESINDYYEDIGQGKYLDINVNIPQRVKDLALEITKDKDSDYDKIKELEYFLSHNYSYTREVSYVPSNADFVDYFLFEEKKGYCTYYASSLAVMGRYVGVPTRYVEGFVLPEKKNSNGFYEVTNEKAHAWVEAYIEGQGWIILEPTSPYNTDLINEINEKLEKDSEYVDPVNPNINLPINPIEKDLDLGEALGGGGGSSKSNINKLSITYIILLILIITCLLFFIIKYRKKKESFKKLNNKDKGRVIFKDINFLVNNYRIINENNYVLDQIIYLLYNKLLDTPVDNEVIRIFNEALYSDVEIENLDIIKLENFKFEIENAIKNEYGKFKLISYRYILRKIH